MTKASCCTRPGNTFTVTSTWSVEGPAGVAHLDCKDKTTHLHGLHSWLRLGPRPALHPRQDGADIVHKLQRLMDSQARHAYRRRLRYSCHLLLLCLDQVVDQQVCKEQAARRAGVHLGRMMMSGCKLCHFAASYLLRQCHTCEQPNSDLQQHTALKHGTPPQCAIVTPSLHQSWLQKLLYGLLRPIFMDSPSPRTSGRTAHTPSC